MTIQFSNLHRTPTRTSKCLIALLALSLLLTLVSDGFAASKRVAVLYFEDHSRFDSPTGCGCLPTGIFSKIFGSGKGRTKWHLKEGFRELLNRNLKQTQVYEPVGQDEIMDAMATLGLSRKLLESDAQHRGALAKALKVDALIVGDIRKFNQERVRANASRLMREGGQAQGGRGSFVGGIQVLGHLYIASVQLDMRFYGTSGNEIDNPKISASRRHQLGGAKVAALEAIVTEEGTEFRFGQTGNTNKKFRPIVEKSRLNEIEFGGPEYGQTLFGLVTDEALKKVILALRENIGPAAIAADVAPQNDEGIGQSTHQVEPIEGRIIYVDAEDPEKAYVNIGSATGIAVHQQLKVYTDEPLIDPETGEVLGSVPKLVGVVEVAEVSTDELSRVQVIEGFGEIKKGDKVRREKSKRPEGESE